jgi:hypothetical protein
MKRGIMNIVTVSSFFKPSWESGGVTRVAHSLACEHSKRGNDVIVLTTDGFKERLDVETNIPIEMDGLTVYYFKNISMELSKRNMPLPSSPKVRRIISMVVDKSDIIHIHEHRNYLAYLVSKAAVKAEKPYIVSTHTANNQ